MGRVRGGRREVGTGVNVSYKGSCLLAFSSLVPLPTSPWPGALSVTQALCVLPAREEVEPDGRRTGRGRW